MSAGNGAILRLSLRKSAQKIRTSPSNAHLLDAGAMMLQLTVNPDSARGDAYASVELEYIAIIQSRLHPRRSVMASVCVRAALNIAGLRDFRIQITAFRSGGFMDEWEFYQHASGKWWWRNVTLNKTSESPARFDSFIHAVGDATRHGYESGVSKVVAIYGLTDGKLRDDRRRIALSGASEPFVTRSIQCAVAGT